MAKVLFVVCVPVDEKDNLKKGYRENDSNSTDEEDIEESKNNENNKDSQDGGVEPAAQVAKVPETGLKTDFTTEIDKTTESNLEISSKTNAADPDESEKKPEERIRRNSLGLNRFFHLKVVDETNNKTSDGSNKKIGGLDEKKEGEGDKNRNDFDKNEGSDKEKYSEDHGTEYVNFVSVEASLFERVKKVLQSLDILAVNWSLTQENVNVGMFIAGDGEQCEEILDRLSYLDIGVIPKSSISVFPASISIASVAREEQTERLEVELEKESKFAEKVSEFKKSIKSRLVVAQVVESVKSDAVFTFDYLMLLILASLVAFMGLLEASSVTLVASMLISPLMGPIIAFVFGAVIRNMELLKLGILSEMKGLALCITVGFMSGFIPAGLESAGLSWRSTESWPTSEMASRGALRSLPVGVLIALPSGAGVALSILGGKVGSLVGVAISASLLPPAVNAGLLWANAIIVSFVPPEQKILQNTITDNSSSVVAGCQPLINNGYIPIYSCNIAHESAVLGVISLLLTVVNILCIIIMGIAVLKIKEVAPIRSDPDAEKDFFAKDLKVARESYETTKGPNSAILGKKFLQEYKKFKQEFGVEDNKYIDNELNEILEDVEEDEEVQEILDRLPHRPKRWNSYIDSEEKATERPYHTIHAGNFRPHSPDEHQGFRKRASAAVAFTPSRMDLFHSPRSGGHRSSVRFFPRNPKNRFNVAKVDEDNHDVNDDAEEFSSPKVEIMPAIKEQEHKPLLSRKSHEV